MLHYVGDASDIKNIILVGGGAFFFKKAIKEAFPKHRIYEVKDALYANVKGTPARRRRVRENADRE